MITLLLLQISATQAETPESRTPFDTNTLAYKGHCFLVRAGSILWFAKRLARSSSKCHKPRQFALPAFADPHVPIRQRQFVVGRGHFEADNQRRSKGGPCRNRELSIATTGLSNRITSRNSGRSFMSS